MLQFYFKEALHYQNLCFYLFKGKCNLNRDALAESRIVLLKSEVEVFFSMGTATTNLQSYISFLLVVGLCVGFVLVCALLGISVFQIITDMLTRAKVKELMMHLLQFQKRNSD